MKTKTILILFVLILCIICYAEKEFVYNSNGKRDPFLPLVSKDGYLVNRESDMPVSDMNLEGIIYDQNGNSLAIINGSILKIGDKIGNYTVTKIEKRKVMLLGNTEESTLELKQEE